MTKEEFNKAISEMKKIQKQVISDLLKKECKKTDQEIQNEVKLKNELKYKHPELFSGTIAEQMLKRLNFKEGSKNERIKKILR
jgi:hypothetical protein